MAFWDKAKKWGKTILGGAGIGFYFGGPVGAGIGAGINWLAGEAEDARNARASDAKRQDDLIAQQQEAARMQREKLERNRRNTKAREGAVRQRGQALRGQMRSRNRARPRGGTILTSGNPFSGSIIGGGGSMGRTSIIGG